METTQTCIECGHVAHVPGCTFWACPQCTLMQDVDSRVNLAALINTYNESSSPSVPRTDSEHAIERDRARIALGSIRRNYIEGRDYKELSNGALWPLA